MRQIKQSRDASYGDKKIKNFAILIGILYFYKS